MFKNYCFEHKKMSNIFGVLEIVCNFATSKEYKMTRFYAYSRYFYFYPMDKDGICMAV